MNFGKPKKNGQPQAGRVAQPKRQGAKAKEGEAPRTRQLARLTAASVAIAVIAILIGSGLTISTSAKLARIEGDMVSVAVATSDIPDGSSIKSAGGYRFSEMPKAYVPDQAVFEKDASSIEGHVAICDIPRGSVITKTMASDTDASSSLANELSSGMVAVTVAADVESGHSGMVSPGDVVEVIESDSGKSVCRDAKVIALGGSMSKSSADYTTVTLQVSASDAAAIVTAESNHGVRLLLTASSGGAR